ncbi:MarR family transcriptional regulator [Bradyrhizobium sp. UFLA03-84]|uniref:helix-turn-helix transcriptional regulator n=1 Tax=Bradyrhizobium sp. UFLA03-84 TaxID=418599 RepID=UPI000BAE58F7|nr:metalloregulator ArsR/SmtB family transcription factor [Bradyrhizobium sp. UFLA03-84]PAY10982.1 MarR family transcriptional regulator [Bradyrhizobium sp. UFLA03-84]
MSQDDPRTQDRILFQLKTRGPQTAAEVGARLEMTSAGARQHLVKLEAAGLVESDNQREGRGRPRKYWRLTPRGHERFPDRHSDLTLDLLRSMHEVFGERGLETLIEHRERAAIADYLTAVGTEGSLRQRLASLARLRSREGYMASVLKRADGFLLIENHCPICAAAAACQGLCRSELAVFRAVLGPDVVIERVDHILAGARRCAYRVTPVR